MKPPYKITAKVISLVALISEKIGAINAAHLNQPPTALRKKNRIKTIQSSLEIEGNTLSLKQITSILENKRVIGSKNEILEVKNAIKVYNQIDKLNPYSLNSFCKAHFLLMDGLIASAGKLRSTSVGIMKGSEVAHIAPQGKMVKSLMNNLLEYLKNDDDLILIKSCVFHYELEFIHPFLDGNGRMGRLWQTLILKEDYPIFKFLPVETVIKERQARYYEALVVSVNSGESTPFIEFMLAVINDSLGELLKTTNVVLKNIDRIEIYKKAILKSYFTRKDYLRYFKEISSATASRDLKYAKERGLLQKIGDKNNTKYKYV